MKPVALPRNCLLMFLFLIAIRAAAPQAGATDPPRMTASQIAVELEHHDRMRLQQLQRYHAIRHYTVEYHGFSKSISGAMDVEMTYDASSGGKNLRILSETGSHLLCEKVLKRAVDSEMEAWRNRASNALSQANYRFKLLGSENLNGRPAFILFVDPLKPSRFLYRGKIWVDSDDFAVAKIEAEPAQNPSFWITRTSIHHANDRAGGFWLPRLNRSESKIRVGGAAVMTIDYGVYQIVPSELTMQDQPSSPPVASSAVH